MYGSQGRLGSSEGVGRCHLWRCLQRALWSRILGVAGYVNTSSEDRWSPAGM